MKPKVNIVVVGYNNRSFLPKLMQSIFASDYTDFEVIFVDNNSKDDSAIYLKKSYPKVRILESKKNLGFAGGNNLGIKAALKNDAEYIFLLNPDTELAPDCLSKLVANSRPRIILQPLILFGHPGERSLVNTSGGVLSYLGFSYCSNYKVNEKKIQPAEPLPMASGAAVWFPAEFFRQAGVFDELFFLYHEDVDLLWRAQLFGYEIQSVYQAKVWHYYSFSRNAQKFYQAERNRWLHLIKNYQLHTLILILPWALITEVCMIVYALLKGWLGKKLASYVGIFQLLPDILKERQIIQRNRVRSDSQLKSRLSSRLGFDEVDIPAMNIYNALSELYWRIIYPLI